MYKHLLLAILTIVYMTPIFLAAHHHHEPPPPDVLMVTLRRVQLVD